MQNLKQKESIQNIQQINLSMEPDPQVSVYASQESPNKQSGSSSLVVVEKKHLKIKIITWNLMGSLPSQASLNKLLNEQDLKNIDILAIGTQQCERTLFVSFFNDSKQTWEQMVFQALHLVDFARIATTTLQGLHLMVFCASNHYKNIQNVETKMLKCGFYGLTGNKGANSVEFFIYDHLVSFINVHLAAQHSQTLQRNASLLEIIATLAPKHPSQTAFVLGDMNYRIDITEEEAAKMNSKKFESLCSYISDDQMLSQKQLKVFFEKYKEGIINFPPTYKLSLTQNRYVQNRIPGWTDRIFYRKHESLELEKYYCRQNIFGSDHRPVVGIFNLTIDVEESRMNSKKKQRPKSKRRTQSVEEKGDDDDCLIF